MTRRGYLIELILEFPNDVDLMELDEVVSEVVDASSARDAIVVSLENWLERARPDEDSIIEVINFYLAESGSTPRLPYDPDNNDGMDGSPEAESARYQREGR